MSTVEAYVQVATDGSGKKVRNAAVTAQIPAATLDLPDVPTTVHQQYVVLADANGNALDFDALRGAITDLSELVRELTDLVRLATS